jgi:hypothetical protein
MKNLKDSFIAYLIGFVGMILAIVFFKETLFANPGIALFTATFVALFLCMSLTCGICILLEKSGFFEKLNQERFDKIFAKWN